MQQIANEIKEVLTADSSLNYLRLEGTKLAPQNTINSREEITNANIQLISQAKQNVISFSGDLSWTKKCHSALIEAIGEGVSVRILCKYPLTDETKRHIQRYFRQEGIEIKYYPRDFDPDVRGLMIDTSTIKSAIFVEKKHKILEFHYQRTGEMGDSLSYEYWGQRLNAENGLAIVSPLSKLFEILWSQAHEASILFAGNWFDVERGLKQVRQYRQANLSMRNVKIANLKPLHRFIDASEYRRVRELAETITSHGFPLWNVVTIHTPATEKIICPPIIEIYDNQWLIVDGLARILYSRQKGLAEIAACVVENVSEPPVGTPWKWNKVEVLEYTDYSKEENFQNLDFQYWRDLDSFHASLERFVEL